MTTQEFELHLITDNPWQTRPLDEDHAQALALDIQENGLLQPPVGRIHPDRPEYIQLAVGHHRVHAFRLLRQIVFDKHVGPAEPDPKWATIPIDVRELTDLQMATLAIAENHARKDLSAIEKAETLRKLIAEFHLTQADAGKPFGLSQSAVAQLLRLLKLPAGIQVHVQDGTLPERLARQLVSVAKIYPAEAAKIANAAAKADPDQREHVFDEEREDLYRAKGTALYSIPWKLDWPAQPIKVEGHKSLSEIPACKGCEFYLKTDYGPGTCLRKECLDQKRIEHAWLAVPAGAKKAGLPAGVRGQAITDLIPIGFDSKYLERALKSKHASLVVVPAPTKGGWQNDNERKDTTGSEELTVATTDMAALLTAVPKGKEPKTPAPRPPYDYKAEEAKRLAQRKRVETLFGRAIPHLARALPFDDRVVRFLWDALYVYGNNSKFEKAKQPTERAALFVEALLDHKVNYYGGDDAVKDARKNVTAMATAFQAKLPAGWDVDLEPPVPPKPVKPKKQTPNGRAAAAATAGAVALAAKVKPNVHGHTRPAPKPSAAKKNAKRKIAKKGSK